MPNYEEEIQLGQYWLILKRRWLPASIAFGLAVASATAAAFLQAPIYQAKGKLILQDLKSVSGLDLSLGGLDALSKQDSPLDTEIEVILSVPILEKTLDQLPLLNTEEEPLNVEDFRKTLTVRKAKAGDVINISFKESDPRLAADVVNKLMNIYETENTRKNKEEVNRTLAFINQQIPRSEQRVKQLAAQVRLYKEQNRIIVPEKEAESFVESLTDLQERRTGALTKVVAARTQANALKQKLNLNTEQAISLTSLSQSPAVQEVLQNLQQAEAEVAVARTQFTSGHPTRIELENRVQALQTTLNGRVGKVVGRSPSPSGSQQPLQVGTLQQELTAELLRLEAQQLAAEQELKALATVQDQYQERIETLPAIEQRLNEMLRELEVAQQNYASLLKQQHEVEVVRTQTSGNASILSPARIPEKPLGPRKLFFVAAGVLLGSVLGFGVAVLLDARDKAIQTLDQIKDLFTDHTVLGVIPALADPTAEGGEQDAPVAQRQLILKASPQSPGSEAFRMVQSNLKYLSSDKQLQVVVITSGVPGEGKSTVAANLALAMSELDQRVLLVDADLRRPVQHHTWDLVNRVGLSDVLVGQAALEEAIQEDEESDVDVLTAGVLPPNPSALLDSEHLVRLLSMFKKDYDLVVVDAPPLSVAADASILSRMADGVLLVVRPGVAQVDSAALSQEALNQPGHNFLGIVANSVARSQNSSYSYYSYSYESSEQSQSDPTKSKT